MVTTTQSLRLTENAVLLKLRISTLGNARTVSTSAVTSDADRTMLKVQKVLLDAPELKEIEKRQRALAVQIRKLALPSFFSHGFYLVGLRAVDRVEKILLDAAPGLAPFVETLVEALPTRQQDAEARLGSLYSVADYPTPEEVRAAFSIAWRWVAIETPEKLAAVNPDLYAREQDKAETAAVGVAEEVRALLRRELAELLDQAIGAIDRREAGDARTIRESNLENLRDWAARLRLRNLTGDDELSEIADSVRAAVLSVRIEELRELPGVREAVRKLLDEQRARLGVATGRRMQLAEVGAGGGL
jgi:hypothetical protein